MHDWDYTQDLKRWFKSQLMVQSSGPNGLFYKGRRVIQRDSRIDGGIFCMAGTEMEYIVVDSKKYSEINKIYGRLINTNLKKNTILELVYALVEQNMNYDISFVEEVEKKYATKKVALDVFIKQGKGVCRHMALLCGVLLEKGINDELLNGKVSVDRNSIPEYGGHAWCRYTNSAGNIYIVDPAQHFLGILDRTDKNTVLDGYHIWNYYRPEDIIC